jgi:hypothetical protein
MSVAVEEVDQRVIRTCAIPSMNAMVPAINPSWVQPWRSASGDGLVVELDRSLSQAGTFFQ